MTTSRSRVKVAPAPPGPRPSPPPISEGWEFRGEPHPGPVRIYQVVGKEEVFEIAVPEDWKVTFGPVAVGSGRINSEGGGSMALRFYEDDKRQRAIFTGVRSFRDLSIPIRRVAGIGVNEVMAPLHKPGMLVETITHRGRSSSEVEKDEEVF